MPGVALIRCDFFSDALELSTSMTVILPQTTSAQIGLSGSARSGSSPTLYLLHGLSDDDTVWSRRTSIERYVAPLGLAVVMPQVNRSFYADEVHGNRYWTFLSEELPAVAGDFFRLSSRREDTFVAGLSMGGYGAMKWALRQPSRFAAAASLSGALDLAGRERSGQWPPGLVDRIFGTRRVTGTDDDLVRLLEQTDPAGLPALYVCCGTDDDLIEDNRAFVAAADERGVDMTVDLGPGAHEWGYWDRTIQDVLAWLPLSQ
jgi:S-formylglutathione hydrolase FrmB